jgi:tetratricopeptide (TPR) repeat protein
VLEPPSTGPSRETNQSIPVTLEPGWNTLLIELDGASNPDGMYVELSRRPHDLARAHLARRDLAAVLRVWDDAGDAERQQWQLLAIAGEAHARCGRWHEAAAIYQRLIERQPVRNRNWTMLAPLLLIAGDEEAYRAHRREMLDHFSESKLPITLERTAKACLLLPDDGRRLKDAIELAQRAAKIGANHPFVAYFHLAHGMGTYRSGDYDEACRLLETARRVDGDRDPYLTVTSLCFLAMAHQRQGHDADARALFEQAVSLTAERLPDVESGDLGPAWSDWLVCELARREAGQLISLP